MVDAKSSPTRSETKPDNKIWGHENLGRGCCAGRSARWEYEMYAMAMRNRLVYVETTSMFFPGTIHLPFFSSKKQEICVRVATGQRPNFC